MKKEKKILSEPVPTIQINAPLVIENTPPQIQINKDFIVITKKWYLSIFFFILFICANGTVWYWYYHTILNAKQPEAPSATAVTHISPSPTSAFEPLAIAVWNGSGIGGEARRVGEGLKKGGYKVIEMSNAQSEQAGSTLFLSPNLASREEEIKKDLLKLDITVEQVKPLLNHVGDYEVLLVVGR